MPNWYEILHEHHATRGCPELGLQVSINSMLNIRMQKRYQTLERKILHDIPLIIFVPQVAHKSGGNGTWNQSHLTKKDVCMC